MGLPLLIVIINVGVFAYLYKYISSFKVILGLYLWGVFSAGKPNSGLGKTEQHFYSLFVIIVRRYQFMVV